MTLRSRKLAGTFLFVIYLIAYCLIAMAIGGQYAVGKGGAVEMAFFVLAGLAWIPGAMLIIRWMSRPS